MTTDLMFIILIWITCRKENAAPSETSMTMSPSLSSTFPDLLICSLPKNPSENCDRTGGEESFLGT